MATTQQREQTPEEAATVEYAHAKASLALAQGNLADAKAKAEAAAARLEAARMSLPPVQRYRSLVGEQVRILLHGGGSTITSTLDSVLDQGILHTPPGHDAPLFYLWDAVTDIQPGW
jgi:hypothetical protein